MPTVPTLTQRSVLTKRGPTAFASPSAPAGAFGATQGQALATLGGQIVGVSDDIFKASIAFQDEDDQREFKKLDIELAAFLTELGRGDGTEANPGFLATRGENTLNAFPKAQRALQEKRKELLERASNKRVRGKFAISSAQRTDKVLSSYLTLVAQQRKLANEAVGQARIEQATDDATAAWMDRVELERAIIIAKQEVAELFKDQSQEVIENETEKAITDIIDKVVTAASREDNVFARKLFEDFENQVDGVNRAALKQRLDARDRELLNKKIAAEARMEKQLKKRHLEIFNKLAVLIVDDKIGEAQIEFMFAKGNISFKQRSTLLKLTQVDDVTTDDSAMLTLAIRIRKGESSFEEIAEAANISSEDKLRLVSVQDQVNKQGAILATREVKDLMNSLDNRIGGVRGPLAILDLAASERVDIALTKFRKRVVEGEDPQTVFDDILKGFKSDFSRDPLYQIDLLARPDKWVGNRFGKKAELVERTEDAIRATAKSFGAGEISQKEYFKQLRLLDEYEKVIGRMVE